MITCNQYEEIFKNKPNIGLVIDYLYRKDFFYNHETKSYKNPPSYDTALKLAIEWKEGLKKQEIAKTKPGKIQFIQSFDTGNSIVKLMNLTSKEYELAYLESTNLVKTNETYSLRDKNNKPLCTMIDLCRDNQMIIQVSENITIDEFMEFIPFLNTFKGYSFIGNYNCVLKITDQYNEFVKNYFTNYDVINLGNKEFLYLGNKLQIIKKITTSDSNLLEFFKFIKCDEAVSFIEDNQVEIEDITKDQYNIVNLDNIKLLIEMGIYSQFEYKIWQKVAIANNRTDIVELINLRIKKSI